MNVANLLELDPVEDDEGQSRSCLNICRLPILKGSSAELLCGQTMSGCVLRLANL